MINASNRLRTLVCFIVGALCLLAGASRLAQAQTTSQSNNVYTVTFAGPLACSQSEMLNLHLAYSADLAPGRATPATVRAFARIRDLTGRVLFISNNQTITIGGTRTERISRRQLAVPQTGPLTLLAEWVIAAPGGFGRDLPASAEVVDGCSGRVLYHTGQGLTLQHRPADGDDELAIDLHFTPLSLAYGQTLRLNVAHQWVFGVELPTAAGFNAFLKFKDNLGEPTSVDVRHLNFRPGQTLVVDFNRDLITEPGDPGTGRLTVWLVVEYRAMLSPVVLGSLWNGRNLPQFPATLQLVDNNNPSAIGLLLPAVQKVREAQACRFDPGGC